MIRDLGMSAANAAYTIEGNREQLLNDATMFLAEAKEVANLAADTMDCAIRDENLRHLPTLAYAVVRLVEMANGALRGYALADGEKPT